jgi:uncharacterized protein affecting Mg2+/Co2+ transport
LQLPYPCLFYFHLPVSLTSTGQQPRIEPGGAWEYISFTPIGTPNGSMYGKLRIAPCKGPTEQYQTMLHRMFDVSINQFNLRQPQ